MLVDVRRMIEIKKLDSSELEHVGELVSLSREAESFLRSFEWCVRIVNGWLDRGWGYIVAVFLFSIEPADDSIPDCVWVIVGDLPPAYIDVQDNPNGACALDAYVTEMQNWVDNVMNNRSVADLIPVNAPPTKEYAEMLQSRIDVIRKEILSKLESEIEEEMIGK